MRLAKIKLAGFKSFVDPTTIPLISNLTAVAGPNGCGKSNVIDAVRWVMGESSAKHLRGGALTDVIFSGSSARKPVGQATVELLFDNTEGKIGGEYANYAEIAIKRQVTRDGQSNYFLNGQRCRRRDITDIFLGTGLGPRSYAIIEQGMISRVIEAKPEDLRVFLEEAAGISKYKERRRETENRIQHTQDNLARINDLRQELDNQLRHLQKQSQAAEKYKEFKTKERQMSAELAAMAFKRLDSEIKEHENQIRETTIQIEAQLAQIQSHKTQQEKERLNHTDANEALNDVQKRYYGVGSEIAKIEQSIHHHHERQQQLQLDKEDAELSLQSAISQLEHDQANSRNLAQLIIELQPQYENLAVEAERAQEVQLQNEEALESWREKMSSLQQEALAPTRLAESEKSKISQLERQIQQTKERILRLEAELSQQQIEDESALEVLENKSFDIQQRIDTVIELLENQTLNKEQVREEINRLRLKIKEVEHHLSENQGQQAALQALQSQALGKDEEIKKSWLANQGIQNPEYLAQKIEVTSGWELALETVLEGFLDAVGVTENQLSEIAMNIDALNNAGINLIEWKANSNSSSSDPQRLVSYIKGADLLPAGIYQILQNVYVENSLMDALARQPSLLTHESIITKEGYWLGFGWIKVKSKSETEQTGLFIREEKLKVLAVSIQEQNEKLAELQFSLEENEEKLKNLEREREANQQDKNRLQQELVTTQSEQKIKQSRIEQGKKRSDQIQRELTECNQSIQSAQQEVNASRSQLEAAVEKMSRLNQEQDELIQAKLHLHEEVTRAKNSVKETSIKVQEVTLKLQTFKTQVNSLNSNIERFKDQIVSIENRIKNIAQSLLNNEEPVLALKEDLEIKLEQRILIESELNAARDKVAEVDNHLREIEQQITQLDNATLALREKLEQKKMSWQALSVRCESALERLKETQLTLEAILSGLPSEAQESDWQREIAELEQKIQRLGAINLAAIEEFEAAQQRKEYLDTQCDDLVEALTTLENAIKKIDREMRGKFQETFDKVNDSFKQLFPRLFGGGQASLVLTGDDLLDTGISLFARPPGKKNSTIQQLSGGEKALTAVALVFAIFQLNPAPFCMLDEVDAPLDDNNVGRFCDLVKEMSKSIQFIYVSHNKLAIEMAEQLQGVTMREPGVSRLVTVDIEEARQMAQA